MAVSGRAGLFTIKESFNPNLTDQVEATSRGQKSGALRLEFGKLDLPANTTAASVRCTVNTGVVAFVTPANIPTAIGSSGGVFWITTSGSFLSGFLNMAINATGQYSGMSSGVTLNYLVVGY